MVKQTHLNVTVDFTKWGESQKDLRIPAHQPIKALILNLAETLKFELGSDTKYSLKATNKGILLSDDDKLTDYPITDGDILEIL
ncbi:YukD family protein [Listeria fleischmannii 1991]|uniref:Uncharacterized ubiquitin-like protein yukD n=3 Tax=Listeria fleischmannii TaxID=1069827 RepID=A0A2X3J3Z2_9LIST|nr:EsaB/YukD family protein [Listeria fleischmannii]EIA21332.1 YukD superfamily protein [Listeria fleischmannii subsp. coloradonensis]EMG28757.1 YukD superfamily protein [Listeria fleischmannii subsp. fleischmannii LU2006-1]KMT60168.1 YukD family protein [Listeria fleischmannii 1991]MBC1397992.1 hypothetical protein [Listeria fleischmannii]MBC1426053.1 hypothetical protein [Listeria fleischmannii]